MATNQHGPNDQETPTAGVPFKPRAYKYREDILLQEIKEYIDSTYKGHYAGGRVQPGELIMAMGLGQQYFVGNIIKYAARYGKKDGYNRKDLMKVIHYAIMTLADADQTAEDARMNRAQSLMEILKDLKDTPTTDKPPTA